MRSDYGREAARIGYRSEDHVQGHGNVKVESIVVDHAHGKEHADHDAIVSGGQKERQGRDLFGKCPFFFSPQYWIGDSLRYLNGIAVFFVPKLL